MALKATFPPEQTDKLGIILSEPELKIARERVANAKYINTQLSKSELLVLSSFAPGDLIYSRQKKVSNHPLAAALLEIANLEANRLYKGKGSWIEIGPNLFDYIKRFNATTHACCRYDDVRDNARLYHSAQQIHLARHSGFREPAAVARVCAAVFQQRDNPACCIRGADECLFNARRALSLHSAYDITPQQWYKIFDLHGLQEADVWMLLPPQMLVLDEFESPEQGFWFKTRGDSTIMGFFGDSKLDSSFGYKHRTSNLKFYLESSIIEGEEFNILLELIHRRGPQVHIRMSRVQSPGDVFRMVSTGLESYVRLPRLTSMLGCNFQRSKLRSEDFVLTDIKKFSKVVQYATSRPDDALTYDKVESYGRALLSRITIGAVDVESSWELREADFQDVMATSYVIAVFRRMKRSKTIGLAVQRLVLEKGEYDWLGSFKNWWADFTGDINFSLFGPKKFFKGRLETLLQNLEPDAWLYFENTFRQKPFRVLKCYDIIDDKDDYQQLIEDNPDAPVNPIVGAARDEEIEIMDALEPLEPTAPLLSDEAWAAFRDGLDQGVKANPPDSDRARLGSVLSKALKSISSNNPVSVKSTETWCEGIAESVRCKMSKIIFLDGGPGTGKTTFYLKKYVCSSIDAVITPTSELAVEVRNKLEGATYNPMVRTLHAALSAMKGKTFGTVVIDECHLLPWTYIIAVCSICDFDRLILSGDPKQIGFIDFEKSYITTSDELRLSNWMRHFRVQRLRKCWRCPKDVVAWLNEHHGYQLEAMSPVTSSLEILPDLEKMDYTGKKCLAFTQYAKKAISERYGSAVNTVHEVQGKTFNSVVLNLTTDALPLVNSSAAHMIVAVTRHTDKIFVIPDCRNDLIKVHLDWDHGRPEEAALRNVEVHSDVIAHDNDRLRPEVATSSVPIDNPVSEVGLFDPEGVQDVLCKVCPTERGEGQFRGVNLTVIPTIAEGKVMKIAADTFAEPDRDVSGVALNTKYFTKRFSAADRLQCMQTMATRYGKRSVRPLNFYTRRKVARELNSKMWNTFYIAKPKIDQESFTRDMFKAMKGMQDRDTIKLVEDIDPNLPSMAKVDFFLKGIDKLKLSPAFVESDKVGQGISAWSKDKVSIFGAIQRAIETADRTSLKPEVLVVNGQDDSRFQHNVQTCDWEIDDDIVEDDLSEQDSSFSEVFVESERLEYLEMGLSEYIVNFYFRVREAWYMAAPLVCALIGDFMQHSGQNLTYWSNSKMGMKIRARYLKFRGLKLAMFSGDDFSGVAKQISKDLVQSDYLEKELGVKTKFSNQKVVAFTSQFWTKEGVYPDLVKYAAKVASKTFKNSDEFNAYQLGVSDWFRSCYTHRSRKTACHLAGIYYDLNVKDAEKCLDFLDAFKRLSWSEFLQYAEHKSLWIVSLGSKLRNDDFFQCLKRSQIHTFSDFSKFQDEYFDEKADDEQRN